MLANLGPRWKRLGLVFGAWTLLGALAVGNQLLSHQAAACDEAAGIAGALDRLPNLAISWLPPYVFWAVVTPLVLGLAGRWRLDGLRSPRVLGVHAGALILAVVTSAGFKSLAHNVLLHRTGPGPDTNWHFDLALFRQTLHSGLVLDVFTYAGIAAVAAAWIYYRDARERLTEAARMQARLADARYEALRAKVEPHFLFNTLNTISALAAEDPAATRDTVASLSALLRRALDHGAVSEVPLGEELAFSQHYLEIERRRYGERLQLEFAVPADTRGLLVPSFLLQPLLENAIRHGTAKRRGPSAIRVEARREDGRLRVRVTDNGPGVRGELATGIGLSSTEARLQELYGGEGRLAAGNAPTGGFEVEVSLPVREGAEATSTVEAVLPARAELGSSMRDEAAARA